MRFFIPLLALPLLLAACAPQLPEAPSGERAKRNVVAKPVTPGLLEVKIKLPVVTRPVESVELRASAAGVIVDMPYDKGDRVEASKVPDAKWFEESTYSAIVAANGHKPTDETLGLRNMRHIEDATYFARIEDGALVQTLIEAQANYDQAVRDLTRLQEYRDTTGSQLDNARTRRSTSLAATQRVLEQLRDTRVFAPFSGMVTERVRQQGEYVMPGDLIATLARLETIRADLELPEAHFRMLNVGDTLDVTLNSLRDEHGKTLVRQGLVVRKDMLAHPQTHSFTVEIDIDNADLALPAGTFGTIELTIYRRENAMAVPLGAIKLNGDERSIFVLQRGDTVREIRDVQLGQLTADSVEILGDVLKPGDRVITTGASWLNDGDPVAANSKEPEVLK
jgi:membrane fusion protein, multidrug efflux system